MSKQISPWHLGATLYMPATRTDIADIILNHKIKGLRSIAICLEDAVNEADLPFALSNLQHLTKLLATQRSEQSQAHWPLIFIRPRNPQMGQWLAANLTLEPIDGWILPKFTVETLQDWWEVIKKTALYMMPTLETSEVFDLIKMRELAETLHHHPCYQRIIALRIGGNDLMNVISLRRPSNFTLYDGPMGYVIKMLVSIFSPRQFSLTAPVCEHIGNHQILNKELMLDIAHGLVGKTAIHPSQIPTIEHAFKVSPADKQAAEDIIQSTQAVFKSQGAMCEPSTHRQWAKSMLLRADIYGLTEN